MDINNISDLIERCIKSCENKEQLDVCKEMIETFIVDRFSAIERDGICTKLRYEIYLMEGKLVL